MSLSQSHNALGGRDCGVAFGRSTLGLSASGALALNVQRPAIVVRFGGEQRRDFRVLRALSGFSDRERERWRMNGERERERTDKTDKNRKKDREQTNKSAGRLNLCVFCVHAGVCECVSP